MFAAKIAPLAVVSLTLGCSMKPGRFRYRPSPQILPHRIQKLSVRPILDKTKHGIADRLTRRITEALLNDGRYPVVPESDSDGVIAVTVTRYLKTAVAYDAVLVPTPYKLRVIADVSLIERKANRVLWHQRNLKGELTYAPSALPGGMTDDQAREKVWDELALQIASRVIDGFGSETGISPHSVPAQPPRQPGSPVRSAEPVNPNPY